MSANKGYFEVQSNQNNMKNTHKIWLVIFVTMASFSCENWDTGSPQVTRLPQVQAGRLSFESADRYSLFIEATINGDIDQIVHDLPGNFVSLKDYNLESKSSSFMRGAKNEFVDDVVWDPYFENILNKDREVRIGDFIYRITKVGVFFYEGDQNKLKMDSVERAWISKYSATGRTSEIGCSDEPYRIDESIRYFWLW